MGGARGRAAGRGQGGIREAAAWGERYATNKEIWMWENARHTRKETDRRRKNRRATCGARQLQITWACCVSQTCGITRLSAVIKVSPNILTLTESPSRGQTVGDSDFATFYSFGIEETYTLQRFDCCRYTKAFEGVESFPTRPKTICAALC